MLSETYTRTAKEKFSRQKENNKRWKLGTQKENRVSKNMGKDSKLFFLSFLNYI